MGSGRARAETPNRKGPVKRQGARIRRPSRILCQRAPMPVVGQAEPKRPVRPPSASTQFEQAGRAGFASGSSGSLRQTAADWSGRAPGGVSGLTSAIGAELFSSMAEANTELTLSPETQRGQSAFRSSNSTQRKKMSLPSVELFNSICSGDRY